MNCRVTEKGNVAKSEKKLPYDQTSRMPPRVAPVKKMASITDPSNYNPDP